jgi:hypothetical protein
MDFKCLQALAADVLLTLHFIAIVFIALGGLLVFRWPRVALIHIPLASWGVILEFMGWICPLTPWEQALRRAAGEGGYTGGFIEHYLVPLVYPDELTRSIQWTLGGLVLLFNLSVYGWWLYRRRTKTADSG